MRLCDLVRKEMGRRPLGLALSIAAAMVATGAYVAFRSLSDNAQESLRASIFKMGHNILIVPRGAPHEPMAPRFGMDTMPERRADDLAAAADLPVGHLSAMYQRWGRVDGKDAIITGIRRVPIPGEVLPPDTPALEVAGDDEALLGASIADALAGSDGRPPETITVNGRSFTVGRVLVDHGDPRDVRVYVSLAAMQALQGDPRSINAIGALADVGPGLGTPLKAFSKRLRKTVGPIGDVVLMRRAYVTGDRSRRMLRTLSVAVAAVLLALCGLGIALYMYNNVAERRYEMAVLVALGYRPGRVALALLSKVALVGVAGGVLGLLAGTLAAVVTGPSLWAIPVVAPAWGLWWQALAFAILLCVAAAVVAVREALRLDPADLLRNQ